MTKSFQAAVLVAIVPVFLFGYSTGVLNAPESVIFPSHTMSQWSTAVSSFCIGGIVGANVSGNLADKYGRRRCLLWFGGYLNIIAGLLHVFTPTMSGLIVARVLVGFAGGTSTVITPMYLGEIAPSHIKGSTGTMTQLSIVLGIMASILMAIPFCTETKWRFIFVPLPALAFLFVLCVPCLLPESPKWLLLNHYVTRYSDITANADDESSIEEEVEMSLGGILHESTSLSNGQVVDTFPGNDDVGISGEYNSEDEDRDNHGHNGGSRNNSVGTSNGSTTNAMPNSSMDNSSFRSFLTHRSNRIAFTSSILFPIAQQLSGINAVFFYSTAFFEGVIDNPQNGTILAFFVNVLATILALLIMDRYGRKTLLSWSAGGMLGCCILLTWVMVHKENNTNNDFDDTGGGIEGQLQEEGGDESSLLPMSTSASASKYWIIFTVMLYITFFEIGLGCIPFFLASELIPSQFLGRVQSISMSANWTSNFLVGMLFPYMDKYLGAYSFVPFGIMLFGTVLYAIFILPETRGKSLDEVMRELHTSNHHHQQVDSNSSNNNNDNDEAIALTPAHED